jgi:MFS-type transporter involved in bile tolerance (Atg22 family)
MMIAIAHFSDRSRTRKPYVWPFLLAAGIALLVAFLSVDRYFWLAYAFLIAASGGLYAPYGPFFSIMPEMLPRNVAGQVIALVNTSGALGAFAGIWLVGSLQSGTGSSRSGLLAMAVSLIISAAITLCLPNAAKAAN